MAGSDSEVEMDESMVFDPLTRRDWDVEQASLHAKSTYKTIVRWATDEYLGVGGDPTYLFWLGISFIERL